MFFLKELEKLLKLSQHFFPCVLQILPTVCSRGDLSLRSLNIILSSLLTPQCASPGNVQYKKVGGKKYRDNITFKHIYPFPATPLG